MVPFDYEGFASNLTKEINIGNIPISRIDDAVSRILRVKFEMGLFEYPFGDTKLKSSLGAYVWTHLPNTLKL